MSRNLWLKWSLRDLRARWLQVTAIALIIAIGTGVFAGLGSTAAWRRLSNDASFAATQMHDLKVSLSAGSYVEEGTLEAIARDLGPSVVEIEERLVAPVQVDASTDDETILVPGRIIGTDVSEPAEVDRLYVTAGRGLRAGDAGSDSILLESNFASFYDLPEEGSVRTGGGVSVDYVGHAMAPEYFMVITEGGAMMAEANFAVLFAPMELAQELSGSPGSVNDLVLRLEDGASINAAAKELEGLFAERLPDNAVTVEAGRDSPAYEFLYEDIENDQQFWNVLAFSILLGAALAAFNLASRVVEAQRREIGMGMAMGVPPRRLAIRPLLFGLEVSILGVIFGLGIGALVGFGLRGMFSDVLPLPVWLTPFQSGKFLQAALLGVAIPFAATALPVWRAVRVHPVDALSTQHRALRGGLVPLLSKLPLRGSSIKLMPLRNVGRSPRRTVLTAMGIGAAMMAMVATFGMLDSFMRTIDQGEAETLRGTPDRMTATLAGYMPVDSPELDQIVTARSVAKAEAGLIVPATARAGKEEIEVSLELLDLERAMWTPTLTQTAGVLEEGIVLAEEAAHDLGIGIGDVIELEHPIRTGATALATEVTSIRVTALHPNPVRINAYMDLSHASMMGLGGLANVLQIDPDGSEDAVKRDLFTSPSVVSVQSVAATARIFRDLVEMFVEILRFMQLFVLGLALLIAFNAASINFDERVRENATIFAFGLNVRSVLRIETIEGLIVGLMGTIIGIVAGLGIVQYIVQVLSAETMPEIGLTTYLSAGTALATAVIGVLAVGIAPLFTVRRLRRMDVPGALRVVE